MSERADASRSKRGAARKPRTVLAIGLCGIAALTAAVSTQPGSLLPRQPIGSEVVMRPAGPRWSGIALRTLRRNVALAQRATTTTVPPTTVPPTTVPPTTVPPPPPPTTIDPAVAAAKAEAARVRREQRAAAAAAAAQAKAEAQAAAAAAAAQAAADAAAAAAAQPRPSGGVYDAIQAYFPDAFDSAVRVAKCESGLNPNAVSPGGANHGLFQINVVHKGRVEAMGYSWSQIYDPFVNAHVARAIYNESGWRPWGCRGAA